jgi:hypothetical protein
MKGDLQMKVPQIKVVNSEKEVNKWLLRHGNEIELIHVSMAAAGDGLSRVVYYCILYRIDETNISAINQKKS